METKIDQQEEIEKISVGLKCDRDVKCRKLQFNGFPRVRISGPFIYCLDSDAKTYRWVLYVGNEPFCSCPLNKYAYKELESQNV
ncbi:MAG: hypothetical protein ACYSR8_10340 [Planctomycetota bacterium]|jgi:hypothetical protein